MEVSLEKEYILMELRVPVEAKIGHTPIRASSYRVRTEERSG